MLRQGSGIQQNCFGFSGVYAHEAGDGVEGTIGREDPLHAPVQCRGGVNGVAHVKAVEIPEQGKGEMEVGSRHLMQPAKSYYVFSFLYSFAAPSGSPRSDVDELLYQLDARLAAKAPVGGEIDEATAWCTIRMLGTERVHKDRGVEEEPRHPAAGGLVGAAISSII